MFIAEQHGINSSLARPLFIVSKHLEFWEKFWQKKGVDAGSPTYYAQHMHQQV